MPSSYRFPHLSEERKALCLQIKKVPPEFKKKKKCLPLPCLLWWGEVGASSPRRLWPPCPLGPPSPGNVPQNLSISSLQEKFPFLCAFQEQEG